MHLNDERVIKIGQHCTFSEQVIDLLVLFNLQFVDHLHGEYAASGPFPHLKHCSECALAYDLGITMLTFKVS